MLCMSVWVVPCVPMYLREACVWGLRVLCSCAYVYGQVCMFLCVYSVCRGSAQTEEKKKVGGDLGLVWGLLGLFLPWVYTQGWDGGPTPAPRPSGPPGPQALLAETMVTSVLQILRDGGTGAPAGAGDRMCICGDTGPLSGQPVSPGGGTAASHPGPSPIPGLPRGSVPTAPPPRVSSNEDAEEGEPGLRVRHDQCS